MRANTATTEPAPTKPALLRYGAAVAAVGAATLVSLWLAPHSFRTPFLLYFPAVVFAAWFGGFRPGILATVLASLSVNYFMLPPHNAFNFDTPSLVQTIFFALTFVSICWVAQSLGKRLQSVIGIQSQLLEMSFDPVIVRDSEDRVIYWNNGAERLYGWTKEEALGRVTHELLRTVHPKPLEEVRAELSEQGRWHGELVHTKKDGSTVTVASWWTLQREAGGRSAILETNFDLTERKKAEESVRYLSAIVESSDAAIIGKALDGTITSWNLGATRLYGYTAEEAIGRPISLLVPAGQPDETPDILARLSKGERVDTYETVRRCKDGSAVDVALKVSPIVDAEGRIIGASSIARNIGKRRRAERKIQELNQVLQQRNAELDVERARWKSVVEGIADEVWICDAEGKMSLVNLPTVTQMELEEFKDKWVEEVHEQVDILYPDGRPRLPQEAPLLRSLRGEICRGEEIMRDRRSGRTRYRQFSSAPVRDAAGAITGAVAIVRDITEHKRVEEALRQSERRVRRLLDSLFVFVGVMELDGTLIEANRAALVAAGIGVEEVVGKKFWDCYWWNYDPRVQEQLRQAIERARSGVLVRHDAVVRVAHGFISIDFAITPMRDEQGNITHLVPSGVDITERKRAQEALIRGEKLASVGRMAATIAHEINNPLAAAINALFLAKSDPYLSELTHQNLELADKELKRVAHIAKQTLGFYREAGQPTSVHLPELVEDVLALYAHKLKNNQIRIERRYRSAISIPGVEGELRQIASNLIANSIDALRENGTLHIRTAGPSRDHDLRPMVRLTIADTGAGISAEHAQRIFEPFFTTKASIGTGLGLWVTHELVKKHEGKIRVRSKPGRGTVFTIWLPAERRAVERGMPARAVNQ